MSLIKNIIIVLVICYILFLIINHFFLKSNIIWDNMSKGKTGSGGIIDSNFTVDSSIYTTSEAVATASPLSDNQVTNNGFATNSLKTGLIVPNSAFPIGINSNFMFSIWFFIDDYNNNNLSNYKYIATLAGIDSSDFVPTLFTFLTPYTNNLGIGILTQNSTGQSSNPHYYYIENIPLQKWNCLLISVVDRTMDIYLEGKLVNSFILSGFYVTKPYTTLYIGNNGNNSFEGYITRARYANGGVNPQEAYNIYKEGIGTSFTGDFFNRYKLKVGLYEYNDKVGGFTI